MVLVSCSVLSNVGTGLFELPLNSRLSLRRAALIQADRRSPLPLSTGLGTPSCRELLEWPLLPCRHLF